MPIFANKKIYIQNKGNLIEGYVKKNSFTLILKKEEKEDGSKK